VGCLWQGEDLVSISLQGTITILNPNSPEQPRRVQMGHNHLITSVSYDAGSNKLYTSDPTAYLIEWDASSGETRDFTGSPHTSAITQVKAIDGHLVTISIDDTVKLTPLGTRILPDGIPLGSQPNGIDGRGPTIVISAHDSIIVLEKGSIINKHLVKFEPVCIALSPDRTEVAVGTKTDQLIHIFTLDGGKLAEKYVIEGHRGEVSTLAYSPCGRFLASGDSNREVKIFEGQKPISSNWVYHTSKIMSVAWSPDSAHLASGSVDSAVIVWSISDPAKRIHLKLSHTGGVRGVVFTNNTTVVSVGEDCCMKSWTLNY